MFSYKNYITNRQNVNVYEMYGVKIALVQDLLRGFYPWEIDEIVSKLSKNNSVDLSKYKNQTSVTDYVTLDIEVAFTRQDNSSRTSRKQ